ncbi:MAG: hypothetical protein DRJ05_05680, partial [Bacteroidetes bacterium]
MFHKFIEIANKYIYSKNQTKIKKTIIMKKTTLFYLAAFVLLSFSNMESRAQNMVFNGDLELWDDANTPTGWDKTENITQESVIVHGGTYSAKQQAGTKDLMQNISGITAGETVTINYYFLDNDDDARSRIWSYWLNGSSTISENAAELRPGTYSSNSPDWQEYSVTLTAPANADGFRFEVRTYNTNAGSGFIYYDDFSVEQGGVVALNANFSADGTLVPVGSTVSFTDQTAGGETPYSYSWDFDGDGTEDATTQNPSFQYNTAGTYTVSLEVTDDLSAVDTETKTDYITVYVATPVSDIATLRAGVIGNQYTLSNEVILTFQQSYRNQKYIEDATAAILIDDAPNGNFNPGLIT